MVSHLKEIIIKFSMQSKECDQIGFFSYFLWVASIIAEKLFLIYDIMVLCRPIANTFFGGSAGSNMIHSLLSETYLIIKLDN